jgi:hypothetical protein
MITVERSDLMLPGIGKGCDKFPVQGRSQLRGGTNERGLNSVECPEPMRPLLQNHDEYQIFT